MPIRMMGDKTIKTILSVFTLLSFTISTNLLAGICHQLKSQYGSPKLTVIAGYGPYFIDGKPMYEEDFWGSTYCRITDTVIKNKSNQAAVKEEVVVYPHLVGCEDSNGDDISITFSNTDPGKCEATGGEITIFCKAGNGMISLGLKNVLYNLGKYAQVSEGKTSYRGEIRFQPDSEYWGVDQPSFIDHDYIEKNHNECFMRYRVLSSSFYSNLTTVIEDGWYNALYELTQDYGKGLTQLKQNYWKLGLHKKNETEISAAVTSNKLFSKRYDFGLKCIMQNMDEGDGRAFPWFSTPLKPEEVKRLSRNRIAIPVFKDDGYIRVVPCKVLELGATPAPEIRYCYLNDSGVYEVISWAQNAYDMYAMQEFAESHPECLQFRKNAKIDLPAELKKLFDNETPSIIKTKK